MDPGIICFRHCNIKSVFCKTIPEECPLCKEFIVSFRIEPFRIPYPFTNATSQSTSIVIKPSHGTFLDNYEINDLLHIGVVNSNGNLFEFDRYGLIINNFAQWTSCIAMQVVPASWDYYWDEILNIMRQDIKWKSINYNEDTMNCFDFVREFLYKLNYTNLQFKNAEDMCRELILPKLYEAVRYITLYKKLKYDKGITLSFLIGKARCY
ncbi:PREDICTED: MKRN2 opposite strand protein [Polistes canadensis]|uniref:MKRN2 opposite strand protein n=1 Tax=Polistes canadensis TaxID=91411 RepID=UPI00071900C8|nr:PREDICTED: MKRN2 opposite strand protein [Polistes canadensis]XP_014604631.1 PREDICTED: MKRN2 opposite strand protein [Polistes canadensis]